MPCVRRDDTRSDEWPYVRVRITKRTARSRFTYFRASDACAKGDDMIMVTTHNDLTDAHQCLQHSNADDVPMLMVLRCTELREKREFRHVL
jgi:hypothetical protein